MANTEEILDELLEEVFPTQLTETKPENIFSGKTNEEVWSIIHALHDNGHLDSDSDSETVSQESIEEPQKKPKRYKLSIKRTVFTVLGILLLLSLIFSGINKGINSVNSTLQSDSSFEKKISENLEEFNPFPRIQDYKDTKKRIEKNAQEIEQKSTNIKNDIDKMKEKIKEENKKYSLD